MKVYFSCSITGGRNEQPVYLALVRWLQAQGHEVLTAHLASPEVLVAEAIADPVTVYTRDIDWLDECDWVLAEVSTPSHGVGYEIAYAVLAHKPVLCLARAGVKVSKMITGNDHVVFATYTTEAQALAQLADFLNTLNSPRLTT